jgi:hypothetical protein
MDSQELYKKVCQLFKEFKMNHQISNKKLKKNILGLFNEKVITFDQN